MRVCYEVFESSVESWQSLFEQAARFASRIGPGRLISISQSAGQEAFRGNNGVVTVWYWDEKPEEGER